jgi:hypothetical protein
VRHTIEKNLSASIEPDVVRALLTSYEKVVVEFRAGAIEECLTQAGKFVEHALRAVEFLRTGTAPPEIRNAAETVKSIEKDKNLPESLRLLIPKVAHAMIYEIRSKRGAVHVKEIDPRRIDAALSVQAASWIVAEFVRLFHVGAESAVEDAMASLMRVELPLVERLGGETIVTANVSCPTELLLLVAQAEPGSLDRTSLGGSSRYGSSTVSKSLQRLKAERFVHQSADGKYHLTGPGERRLANDLRRVQTR